MSTINQITCPKCNHSFNAEQVLAQEVEDKLRAEYNSKFKGIQLKLQKEAEEKELQQKTQFEQERKQLEQALKNKVREDYEIQVKGYQEELQLRIDENNKLKLKEVELMRAEQKLKDMQQDMQVEFEKKLLERQRVMAEEIQKHADEQNQAKNREKDAQMDQLRKQIDEMKRKAEQGSMQLQGEAQEIFLEELLRNTYPLDLIEEVGKGVRGADVIHTVRNNMGRDCGCIIYEAKNTKAFSEQWIDKLKSDLRTKKADIAVLVTSVMPKDMTTFGLKEGIWICTFDHIKGLSHVLRDGLIRVTEARGAEENRGEKMQLLYSFLTGNEFRQQIEAIVEAFSNMQMALSKEKIAMQKIWKEREKQIDKVIESTTGMYGSIKGIAGSAVRDIKALELGGEDDVLLEE